MCRPASSSDSTESDCPPSTRFRSSGTSNGTMTTACHNPTRGKNKDNKGHYSSSKLAPHHHPPVYFHWGRLRIGFHAMCATTSFLVTIVAYLTASRYWIMTSVVLNSTTAYDARNLLPQVPLKTEIIPGIVAPHKEAFKRTMSMMHYVNLRILGQLYDIQSTSTLYQAGCWAFGWYFFAPVSSDFGNGNTWIFVVPMFLAVITDIPQLLLLRDALQMKHYLLIELSALIIAFGFTLAFRGFVSVQKIYIWSALYVAALFVGVMHTILVG